MDPWGSPDITFDQLEVLELRKLWTMNGTFVRRCGNVREVNDFIDNMKTHTKLKYFFLNVGCNDLDSKSGDEVFAGMTNIIEKLRRKFPGIKIILSEITPRMDMLDLQVKATNTLLNQYVDRNDDLFIAQHSNMRDPDFFIKDDPKHFHANCIARFASNIKKALNLAYGREQLFRREHKSNHPKVVRTNTRIDHENLPSQNVPPEARSFINNFKEFLLTTLTGAFERADF